MDAAMKINVPTASKLQRDRSNWNTWMRLCRDILQAPGDWGAVTQDYSIFDVDSGSDEDGDFDDSATQIPSTVLL